MHNCIIVNTHKRMKRGVLLDIVPVMLAGVHHMLRFVYIIEEYHDDDYDSVMPA